MYLTITETISKTIPPTPLAQGVLLAVITMILAFLLFLVQRYIRRSDARQEKEDEEKKKGAKLISDRFEEVRDTLRNIDSSIKDQMKQNHVFC